MIPGPGISFEQVRVNLGGSDVLAGISFEVRPGTIHALIGPNGGGKTTLVRALLGQTAHEGRIAIHGRDRFVVGYAPQSIDLDRSLPLTALDVMAILNQRRPAFLGRSLRWRNAQDRALARVGLEGKGRRLFGLMSGGERQRLLFAQALVPIPDLLIMDEPTANMDADGSALVEQVVRELAAGGTTVVWINHDWEQVRRVADAVTAISRSVLSQGSPEQVLSNLAGKALA